MVFASLAEVISIGSALPFLGALAAPERIFQLKSIQPLINTLGLTDPKELILPLTILFLVAALIAGVIRLLLLWATTRLAFATGAELSIDIYRRTLYQAYEVHCSRNSSEIIDGITTKANSVIHNTIVPILTMISSIVVLVAIVFALISVEPLIATLVFFGFGSIYVSIVFLTRKQLSINSKRVAFNSTLVIKSLQEGLGGIRDVLIDGNQAAYCKIYQEADLSLRDAQGNNYFISQSPRYVIEALSMIFIALVAYVLSQQADGFAKSIPVLGVMALGAQRLLPALQQAYSSWVGISGSQESLMDALKLLDQPMPEHITDIGAATITFDKEIALERLSFRYSTQTSWVLRNANLIIKKGSHVGFIGTTGSGKSTLLDIVMGLLQPTDGLLIVDGQAITLKNCRSWQSHIAHVPQSIFLADATIAENIAFGIPANQVDYQRVIKAAKQAEISDAIEALPKQYETLVGERGIRLSGGQRQRIGIARALYKAADVIIFDEATSALDNETEKSVMDTIEHLSRDLTVLIIAHRLSTLKNCSQIFEVVDSEIRSAGNYQDITFSLTNN
jgi:ATP-binding cassette subfamily B protein